MSKLKIKDGFINEKIIVCPQNIIDKFTDIPIFTNMYITDIGFFPNAKFHYRERITGIEEFILILCTKGEGTVKYHNKTFSLSEMDLIIIPRNTPHTYYTEETNPWDILWMHFNGNYVDYFFKNFKFNNKIHCSLENFRTFKFLFSEILDTLEKGLTEHNLVHSSQLLSHMISQIFLKNSDDENKKNTNTRYIDDAVMFMKENINMPLTLDEISDAIGLSKSHVSLIFKKEVGHSPVDFFTHLKIQSSCSMLKYTDTPINEIATNLGYLDQYYFSRVFKKIIGVSPMKYRKDQGLLII